MMGKFIFIRLRALFTSWKTPGTILLNLFLVVFVALYATMYGWLGRMVQEGQVSELSLEQYLFMGWMIVCAFTFFRMFFPSYAPLKQDFPRYYPLSPFQRYVFSIVSDLLTTYFLLAVMALLIIAFILPTFQLPFFFVGLGVLTGTHLLRRNFQYILDFRLSPAGYVTLLLIIGILVFWSYSMAGSFNYLAIQAVAFPLVFLISGYIQERAILTRKQKILPGMAFSMKGNHNFKLVFKNPKTRILVLIAVGMKGLLLAGIMGVFKNLSPDMETMQRDNEILMWAFVTPFLLFGYIYNNTWAFWTAAWQNIERRFGDFRQVLKLQLRLLLIPLLLDFVITIALVFPIYDDWLFVLVFYLGFTLYMVFTSVFWSLFTPVKVKAAFQMKRGNCSTFSAIVSMASLGLLLLIKSIGWVYYFIPVYILAGLIALWLAKDDYPAKKYQLVRKLK